MESSPLSLTNFNIVAQIWLVLAIPIFVLLQFMVAPFGRHTTHSFGKTIHNQTAWVLMEATSFLGMLILFVSGPIPKNLFSWLFVLLWLLHYFNRAFIYPFRQKNKQQVMPVAILVSGIIFNFINSILNGYYLGYLAHFSKSLLITWHFWVGLILFVAGAVINIVSDNILLGLRKPGESTYRIPYGFLFNYVSCPNHLGEIIEWIGFAFLTWNWASTSFAVWTIANLAPRAKAHHNWYKINFENYPPKRKALIPLVW